MLLLLVTKSVVIVSMIIIKLYNNWILLIFINYFILMLFYLYLLILISVLLFKPVNQFDTVIKKKSDPNNPFTNQT